jgi:hypothetical protein
MRWQCTVMMFLASLPFCHQVSVRSEGSVQSEAGNKIDGNKEQLRYPILFDKLKEDLLANGWTLTGRPDPRASKAIVSKREEKVRTKFDKPTKIRFSWVVIDKPRQVPPGKEVEIRWGEKRSEATDTDFTLEDGTVLGFSVSKAPDQIVKPEEAGIRISQQLEARKEVSMILVHLQQMIEIVQDGKTTEKGYLPHTASVVFEKKDK